MKKMYFGTREKMQWIKCPATNISRNRNKWQETGGYLNGGAFSAQSSYSHLTYDIAWNLMASEEAAKIMSYYEGIHGDGLIYFLEPFAKKSNILPLHWSVPRLCAKDAPNLLPAGSARPTTVSVAGGPSGYPLVSAQFAVAGTDSTNPTLYIPVPPGENFYLSVRGAASGSAGIRVIPDTGTAVTLAPTVLGTPATTVQTNPGGVTLRLAGTGTFALNSMHATVGTSAPDYSVFRQGEGNSGVRFSGPPVRTGYSSALDLESVTAEFMEVGAWL